MKKNKKKILFIVTSIIILVVLLVTTSMKLKSNGNSDVLNNQKGEIFYTKRVDDVNTLFKSDANLKNEILVYSHRGKGKDSYGDYNDNIGDFYYDSDNKTISFIAMNDGDWSLYTLKEDENIPTLIDKNVSLSTNNVLSMLDTTDYIKNEIDGMIATQKSGSIFITKDNEDICVKKFIGIYDEKFTGYRPIGFSPDGKYLVYHSLEHITSLGTIFGGAITGSYGNVYIMDLSSGKNSKYVNISRMQWIAD